MKEERNKSRAQAALKALRAYPKLIGRALGADARENIVDLVTDLLHLAYSRGIEAEQVLRFARMHFMAEAGTEQ